MRIFLAGCAAILWSSIIAADERRAVLYATWGDAQQCARVLLVPGGTVRAEPFVISDGWLRQGQFWCQLSWFDLMVRSDGVFTSAQALCGEDVQRGHRLDFALRNGALTLIWDEVLVNGPLERCAGD